MAWLGKARIIGIVARSGMARWSMVRLGGPGLGMARRGKDLNAAWFGTVACGQVWHGSARHGVAGRGREFSMIKVCEFKVEGISNILMHNPISMRSGANPTMGKKKIPSAEEEAAAAVYRNGGGELVFPSIGFKSSLLRGCTGKRIGKVSAAGQVAAGVFEVNPYTILLDPKTDKPLTKYQIFTARCVVQKNGVMRSRAEVGPWKATVVFEVDDDFVTEVQVRELLNIAGRIAGVGDWRPEKRGRFGRYRVV
jgi:hypothetical protein